MAALETNAPKIVIALLALSTASLVFMVLRFFCKGRYSKQFGWDDYIIAFSWVSPRPIRFTHHRDG